MRRHPSKRALREWLSGERTDDIDAHIDSCERCAAVLEELEPEESSQAISDALAFVLSPPGDLTTRLQLGVAARLDSRQIAGVVADLFGAGLETSRLLLSEESPSDDL